MKAISLLFLLGILISCNESPSLSRRNAPIPQPLSSPSASAATEANDQVVVIEETNADAKSHELVVEIDQVNSIFTVTGNAGKVCGVEFNVIDRLRYEVLSADQARITLKDRGFDLTRIDNSSEEKIWGDWKTEITEGNYHGNMIFHIRLDPVMKVEADCELIP